MFGRIVKDRHARANPPAREPPRLSWPGNSPLGNLVSRQAAVLQALPSVDYIGAMELSRSVGQSSLLALCMAAWCAPAPAADEGKILIKVIDKQTSQPLAARMHLKDQRGRAVRVPKVPYWRDHFVFDGQISLELPLGLYTFEVECGPEYKLNHKGHFTLERNANDTSTIVMERFVNMKGEGWWSGDLHIHRPPADMELLMKAEDLHIAPVITWWNNQNAWKDKSLPEKPLVQFDGDRFYQQMAGEDEREGGALLYFNLPAPLPIAGAKREHPSPVAFLDQAREQSGVHIDVEKPFWWDMPVWVATGHVHSLGLANNHLQRDGMLDNEAWGKPRDQRPFPSPDGNGRWSQHIYHQLLNCGLRIPPSAGSASGVLPNPVGYNRVYVYCGEKLTWDGWWQGLREGKVVVTNGPMLRPRVFGPGAPEYGALPGHVFQGEQGKPIELQVELKLSTREPIEYLEIIQDGRSVHEVRLDQLAQAGGKLPPVVFPRSGWFIVRAISSNSKTFRFASTGPYYVEIGQERRVSKSAAQFFSDWVHERAARIKLDDPREREDVIQYHRAARDFWQKKVAEANAD